MTTEPFELLAETVAQEPRTEPAPTLVLDFTDQSFTRPVTRRERALRAHAAALRAAETTDTLV